MERRVSNVRMDSGGIFKYTDKHLFDGTSLLMGRKGSIDNPMLVSGPFWTVDTMFYTSKINENVLPKFLEERKIKPDVVFLDPPRKGCDRVAIETLLNI